jgi:hypothetical protein
MALAVRKIFEIWTIFSLMMMEECNKGNKTHQSRGVPRLLPSPHIQRANAVDHNDCVAVPERVNEDASGWLYSDSSISTDNKYEENEAFVALESPCRPLATQMSTPPPPPASAPRTPSGSRPVKIPSTPCHNKSEDNNSPVHPNSHGARQC